MPKRQASFSRRCAFLGVAALSLCGAGCTFTWPWVKKSPDAPVDTMSIGSSRPELDASPAKTSGALAKAHELFRQEAYSKAQSAFHEIAEDKKNSAAVCEEARFYEAESLYRQDRWPGACDTYSKMLQDHPSGHFRDQAVHRMFDIASFWLKDTDEEMKQYKDKLDGKRMVVMPAIAKIHLTDPKLPTIDTEGRAIHALEVVHYSDVTGPLADRALFLAGYIKFYREDYPEADHYFTQLIEQHKESPLVPQAIELDIICKSLYNGGPDYDGKKVAEARQLIDTALRNYPEMAKEKHDFLMRQMTAVTAQQAEKEIHRAEFYERIGHPGSAYFIYAAVARRYRNTKYEEKALEQMARLRKVMETQQEQEKHPTGINAMMDSVQKSWNHLWGLDSQDGSNVPPSGVLPQNAAPLKPVPGQGLDR